jgi:hypothetical protein
MISKPTTMAQAMPLRTASNVATVVPQVGAPQIGGPGPMPTGPVGQPVDPLLQGYLDAGGRFPQRYGDPRQMPPASQGLRRGWGMHRPPMNTGNGYIMGRAGHPAQPLGTLNQPMVLQGVGEQMMQQRLRPQVSSMNPNGVIAQ